jgi:hypothetical protein
MRLSEPFWQLRDGLDRLSHRCHTSCGTAKAALMVDMAVKYDETPDRKTDFGSMRDSMYLLLVMNQYTLKPDVVQHNKKEAECLLRIALFSKDLKLTDTDKSLRVMRRILARELREMRRRGAVPGK